MARSGAHGARRGGNINDMLEVKALLHGPEGSAYCEASYQHASRRPDVKATTRRYIANHPGKRQALLDGEVCQFSHAIGNTKARVGAKMEHPFRGIKRRFGHVNVRYRGLAKNTAQLHTLFARSDLRLAPRKLTAAGA